jgi:hypothetical protein
LTGRLPPQPRDALSSSAWLVPTALLYYAVVVECGEVLRTDPGSGVDFKVAVSIVEESVADLFMFFETRQGEFLNFLLGAHLLQKRSHHSTISLSLPPPRCPCGIFCVTENVASSFTTTGFFLPGTEETQVVANRAREVVLRRG